MEKEEKEGSIKIEEVKTKKSFKNLSKKKILIIVILILFLFGVGVVSGKVYDNLTSTSSEEEIEVIGTVEGDTVYVGYEYLEDNLTCKVTLTSNTSITLIEVKSKVETEEETTEETDTEYEYIEDTLFEISDDGLTAYSTFTENESLTLRITLSTLSTLEVEVNVTDILVAESEEEEEATEETDEIDEDDDEENEENTNTTSSNTSTSTSSNSTSSSSNKSNSSSSSSSNKSSSSSNSSSSNKSSSSSSNSSSSSSKNSTSSSSSSSSSSSNNDDDEYVSYSSVAKQIFNYINKVREENGVSSIEWSSTIAEYATLRAYELPSNYSHSSSYWSVWNLSKTTNGWGENICLAESASNAVAKWENSTSGHFETMIDEDWTHVGVGVVKSNSSDYWCSAIFITSK